MGKVGVPGFSNPLIKQFMDNFFKGDFIKKKQNSSLKNDIIFTLGTAGWKRPDA